MRAPTCLLLKSEKSFDSFGYEAMDKYAFKMEVDEQDSCYYFERFKIKLHTHKVREVTSFMKTTCNNDQELIYCAKTIVFVSFRIHKQCEETQITIENSVVKILVEARVKTSSNL